MMKANECLNTLFEVQNTTHVMHLQTNNYNDHKVLGAFYESMVGLIDEYAEQYQGNSGEIIADIGSVEIKESAQPIVYLEEFKSKLEEAHEECEFITVKLVIESIMTLVNKTLFLLKLE